MPFFETTFHRRQEVIKKFESYEPKNDQKVTSSANPSLGIKLSTFTSQNIIDFLDIKKN